MGKGESCGLLPTEKLWLTPCLAKRVRPVTYVTHVLLLQHIVTWCARVAFLLTKK